MKNFILLILMSLLVSTVRSQTKSYTIELTDKHIAISETNISVVPPVNFKLKSIPPQLVNDSGCKIAIREMTGVSY